MIHPNHTLAVGVQRQKIERLRAGFTLVEMLVAMALTVFIMSIVTTAFVVSLETFRQLKGIGDMQQGLRTASNRLVADLRANHFDGKKRLSNPHFWQLSGRPREGFFRIVQPTFPVSEGIDQDGQPSFQASNQVLHFSVRMTGNRGEDFFSASVPASSALFSNETNYFNQPADNRQQLGTQTFNSQWGEIAYFLVRQGTTTKPDDPTETDGTPLFSLYRVQRVVVPRNDQLQGKDTNFYPQISCNIVNGNTQFYSPSDLAEPVTPRRRGFDPVLGATRPAFSRSEPGSALLLQNVVSFQTEIMTSKNPTVFERQLPNGDFDTAMPPPNAPIIQALKITLRVFDPKTRQSRQISIIQDM